jgi:hypothetical protein
VTEPVNLERYLRDATAGMSRYDAFVFVRESLPSAFAPWIGDLIGCHRATVNRYIQCESKKWRCQVRRRKKYERRENAT